MLWTTLIGAAITVIARAKRHRQAPLARLFRGAGRGNKMLWMRYTQPVMHMVRRMAR
jgi:hypothetical protein